MMMMMMMMKMVTITDLRTFAGYSQLDIILLFLVCCVEVPDIASLAVFSVDGDVGAAPLSSPHDGHLVPHSIPQNTGQLVPALLQAWLHLRNNPSADNYFNFIS